MSNNSNVLYKKIFMFQLNKTHPTLFTNDNDNFELKDFFNFKKFFEKY